MSRNSLKLREIREWNYFTGNGENLGIELLHWNWGKCNFQAIELIPANKEAISSANVIALTRLSAEKVPSFFRELSVNCIDIKKVGGNRGKFRNSIISFRNPMAINANWFKDDAMVIKAMASTEKCYLNANFMTTIRIKVAFLI